MTADPLINEDTVVELNLMTQEDLAKAKKPTRRATRVVEESLAENGLTLIDIKFEFGSVDGRIVLMDEVSGDCMRVMDHDGDSWHKRIYIAKCLIMICEFPP